MNTDFDVAIVGSGLVGASLAIALETTGLRVAVVEAIAPKANLQPTYDERNLALARASVQALNVLDVWRRIACPPMPIQRIHVSRRGDFGTVRLHAAEHGLPDFGAIVPARELGNALLSRLDNCAGLTRICPAQVIAIDSETSAIRVRIRTSDTERTYTTRLLVGADGSESWVRSALGIAFESYDYHQTCFVTTITPERAMNGCAYERFTDSGPVAVLPLSEGRAGLVLTVPDQDASQVEALSDEAFMELVHERFGYRLGRLTRPGKRRGYPLRRVQANALTAPRAVLIGNAAQTVHPIGAQGFNLGLRDALTLAQLLINNARCQQDPGDVELLTRYVQLRNPDRSDVLHFGDSLLRLCSNGFLPLRLLRCAGFLAVDRIAPLKHSLVLRGMGFRHESTTYALGYAP